jgi:sugar/nucleoside kinase (ribokinase family)
MSIVVVGSVAFDSLETPLGKRDQALGGSANYFSICASYFTKVSLVGVVGEDFPADHVSFLQKKGINTDGLQRKPGKTFHWKGKYGADLNEAQTLDTQLNVFADFDPILPAPYQHAETVFLANIHPDLQRKVLEQVKGPKLIGMDSMNLWINIANESLKKTIAMVDVLFLNETESRLLSGEHNILKAAKAIQKLSTRELTLVIKRGEYGALLFSPAQKGGHIAFVPAFPLEAVFDPTGAGDTFAGGVMGYLDRVMTSGKVTDNDWRHALTLGTAMASFVVEQFSFDRTMNLSTKEIAGRVDALRKLSLVDGVMQLA